jgi:hypothetical protein
LYDITHSLRKPLAVCSNDAKSCYDGIVHSVASLALQWVRMPIKLVVSMLYTIQNLAYIVHMIFGNLQSSINSLGLAKPF